MKFTYDTVGISTFWEKIVYLLKGAETTDNSLGRK